MLILDTDHFSELMRGSRVGVRLGQRLDEADEDIATTIITLDEQARGWLGRIRQVKTAGETIDGAADTSEARTAKETRPASSLSRKKVGLDFKVDFAGPRATLRAAATERTQPILV